jgi:hypothetical protein
MEHPHTRMKINKNNKCKAPPLLVLVVFVGFGTITAISVYASHSQSRQDNPLPTRHIERRSHEFNKNEIIFEHLSEDNEPSHRKKDGHRSRKHKSVIKKAMKYAIMNNDYGTWTKLAQGRRIGELIDADNFPRLQEAWKLAEEGDKKGARSILKNLGIGKRWML